jgi:hypothetical protein
MNARQGNERKQYMWNNINLKMQEKEEKRNVE